MGLSLELVALADGQLRLLLGETRLCRRLFERALRFFAPLERNKRVSPAEDCLGAKQLRGRGILGEFLISLGGPFGLALPVQGMGKVQPGKTRPSRPGIAVDDPLEWGASPPDEHAKLPHFGFEDDAQGVFVEWSTELNRERLTADEPPLIAQHLAKFENLFGGLALVFHLVDCAATSARGAISKSAAFRAAAWCDLLEAHARRCYGLLIDEGQHAASTLARRIEAGKLTDGFTSRDVRRKGWQYLKTPAAVEGALEWLEDDHWLRGEDPQASGQGGRPTRKYRINPAVLARRGRPREND